MRIGCCADSEQADLLCRLGYDFIELGVAELVPERPEREFAPVRDRIIGSGLRAEAVNRLFPRGMMVVGPDVDAARTKGFVDVALARAAAVGGEIVVWGSGHARHIPDGFPRERAVEQLVECGVYLSEAAARHGQTIAIEPLDRTTTNTIWTVRDGLDLARLIDRPSVKVVADIYHMHRNGDDLDHMADLGAALAHVHLSDPDRSPPGNPAHYPFYAQAFRILRDVGYTGRASVEARFADFEPQAQRGLEVLRDQAQRL